MSRNDSATTISAKGVALTDFNTVIMSVVAHEVCKNSVDAKAKVQKTVRLIEQAVQCLKAEHDVPITPGNLIATYEVTPETDYRNGEHVFIGYKAQYGLQFKTEAVDKVSVMQDVLTAVPDVLVRAPDFRVKDAEAAKKAALEDAWATVQKRLKDQCEILARRNDNDPDDDPDFDTGDLEIRSWNVKYDRRVECVKAAALEARPASGGSDDPIRIESGKARIEVELTVDFG